MVAAHQTSVTAKAMVPVTSPTIDQRTSSHDCGSRSGVSIRRQKPAVLGGQRYDGVAASRPSMVRSRNRSSRAMPRATITDRVTSRIPPMKIASATPRIRSTTTSTSATRAMKNAERL